MIRSWLGLLLLSCSIAGCGGEGGSIGDANDPATTTDLEQMADETGDVDVGPEDTE